MAMASSAIEMRSPGGEQHVQLAARRQRADLVGQVEQLVGGVAHRGDHHHDVVAGLAGGDDALGDPLDPLGVGDGRAAVLLHDECHDGALPPSDPERADAAGTGAGGACQTPSGYPAGNDGRVR